nr:hypothetical protein B0A51_15836 [Rachicladosporium sp. CCFEE 5018]
MFRKPRADSQDLPDVGRRPFPTRGPAKTPFSLAVAPTVPPPSMPIKVAKAKATPLPTIGRQGLVGSAKKAPAKSKLGGAGNGNILSFFKKEASGLFVEDRQASPNGLTVIAHEDGENGHDDEFEDRETPSKRRRLEDPEVAEEDSSLHDSATSFTDAINEQPAETATKSGPFVEASDSEDEGEEQTARVCSMSDVASDVPVEAVPVLETVAAGNDETIVPPGTEQADDKNVVGETEDAQATLPPPALIKEETSYGPALEDFKDFEGMDDDFDEDLFEEGDELRERRYMEEQARLEAGSDEKDYDVLDATDNLPPPTIKDEQDPEDAPCCPICSVSLGGVSESDASQHVNSCLDGNPQPLPVERPALPSAFDNFKHENISSAAQFRRPVRPPRAGQQNPFELAPPGGNAAATGSAFSKLMSGHTEEAAWAEAAAAEHASRGKSAYTRTCPFYKIMPGMNICVDAFRYGAVVGCNAYFLSHFHSDHYIGLTSSWCHGPIYCSYVTANLVRQQLRVDPKYVIDLDFEKSVEVPGTNGVKVTMISANHCPGSSLYLFGKVIGKQKSGEPKLQRILHCGDFRACRAHVTHPLLMPDVQDAVSGKSKEQKIDVCYLDTTYLNPKYAFPSQQTVIQACADMCVSLSKHTPDASDGWEQMKRQRAGEGMVKFIQRESTEAVAAEEPPDGTESNVKLERNPSDSQQIISSTSAQKTRGRLLVIVGTYSIGKERICVGIAHALKSKIFAPAGKMRIVKALEDPELDALMTLNPREAQVHMTPLFEIRADTLDDYLKDYFPHFTRAVGFRPSGWNYKPPTGRFTDSPPVSSVLYSDSWKSVFNMKDLVPQRGITSRASCFGVPYSEHSSFRELTMFCCSLRIERIVPTVNVGSAKGRERMKGWCERWAIERKNKGIYQLPEDGSW